MPKCIECGQQVEYCICTEDPLLEDEEASDYINIGKDAERMLTQPRKRSDG